MESNEHLNCLFNRIKSFLESTTDLTIDDKLRLCINHRVFTGIFWDSDNAKHDAILSNSNHYTIFELFSHISIFFACTTNYYDQVKLEKSDFAKVSKHLIDISDPHELEIKMDLLGI
jgi:hypothetical protein